jgi:hypothetical protein
MKPSTVVIYGVAALALAGCGGSGGGMQQPANAAPTISEIGSQATDQDTPLTLAFNVSDRESPAGSLMVSVSAADTTVFPADGLVVSGESATRTLTLTPLEATAGPATITVNVADPQGAVASRSFQVAVRVRDASLRAMALDTFAKGEADEPTTVNGWTRLNDADSPEVFAALLGAE